WMTATASPATPERRPRMAGAERRDAILSVARTLFARQGYHGTSTGQIARTAGCSEAVLSRHFPSKQALFAAVPVRRAGQLRRHPEEPPAWGGADPLGGPGRAFATLAAAPDVPEHLRLRSLAVTMVDEPEIRATLEELHLGFRRLLTEAARTSQRNGHVRAD